MRIPRFFIDPAWIDVNHSVVRFNDRGIIDQIGKVLRLSSGDQIDVLDGKGNIFHCALTARTAESLSARSAEGAEQMALWARILSHGQALGEPNVKLAVAIPILRSGRLEWAIEKLTEIGASLVIPLITTRGVVHLEGPEERGPGREAQKLKRWRAVAREAAQQCERGLIPDVVAPVKLAEFLEAGKNLSNDARMFLCAERESAPSLSNALSMVPFDGEQICCIVGPEGGFTPAELDQARGRSTLVSLGQRILRSETAAVFAAVIVVSQLDKQATFSDTTRDIT